MTALTTDELLDIDPVESPTKAYSVAIRHAWNAAVRAEWRFDNDYEGDEITAERLANVSQAWSSVALCIGLVDDA